MLYIYPKEICGNPDHQDQSAIYLCLNQSCQFHRNYCFVCENQRFHQAHSNDIKFISELENHLESVTDNFQAFFSNLDSQIQSSVTRVGELQDSFRNKLQLIKEKINIQNNYEVSQALNSLFMLTQHKMNCEKQLNQCFSQLDKTTQSLKANVDFLQCLIIPNSYRQKSLLLNAQGQKLYDSNQYAEAYKLFDLSVCLYPQQKQILNMKGDCLRMNEKYSEAQDCYENALSIDPKYVPSLYGKGKSLKFINR